MKMDGLIRTSSFYLEACISERRRKPLTFLLFVDSGNATYGDCLGQANRMAVDRIDFHFTDLSLGRGPHQAHLMASAYLGLAG